MTALPEFLVLDVGHGNCSVLIDSDGVIVVDAPPGDTLIRVLEDRGIKKIDKVVVSHADSDHIGGVTTLLLSDDFAVGEIFVNSDAKKSTDVWTDFRYAIENAVEKKQLKVRVGISASDKGMLDHGAFKVEILSPSAANALGGVGGKSLKGQTQTANSLSVVLRILYKEVGVALLPADIDESAFQSLISSGHSCAAKILVFPHHGGQPGKSKNISAFAESVAKSVSPETVVFSIGRGKNKTPHPDIVKGVRKGAPEAHIFCTQLSENCAKDVPSKSPSHLGKDPARGKSSNSCCGGTFSFSMKLNKGTPDLKAHKAFVKIAAPQKLC